MGVYLSARLYVENYDFRHFSAMFHEYLSDKIHSKSNPKVANLHHHEKQT
jgi:hypothetical protein